MSRRLYLRSLHQSSSIASGFKLHKRSFRSINTFVSPTRNARSCRYIHISQPPSAHTQQSSVGPVTVALVVFSCWIGGSVIFYHFSGRRKPIWATGISEELTKAEISQIMPTAALAGRPGNLTAEQDVKLQELWKATLKVFGVPVLGAEADNGSPNGSEKGDSQDGLGGTGNLTTPEKKRKKRISLFGRKKHDKDGSEESVNGSPGNTVDSDDKYGQTKLFYEALANQTPEELRKAFWSMVKHDHPDGLLLRFLRARKWDVQKALVMMVSTMHWRLKEVDVDGDIVLNGEAAALKDSMSADAAVKREGTDFLTQLRLGKSFLHGTDKEGRPICFVRVRLHRQGEQTEASLERFTILMLETARLMLSPPVDTAVWPQFRLLKAV